MNYNSIYLKEGQTLSNVQDGLKNTLNYLDDVAKNFSQVPYELQKAIAALEDFSIDIDEEIEDIKLQEEYELEEKIKPVDFSTNKLSA